MQIHGCEIIRLSSLLSVWTDSVTLRESYLLNEPRIRLAGY